MDIEILCTILSKLFSITHKFNVDEMKTVLNNITLLYTPDHSGGRGEEVVVDGIQIISLLTQTNKIFAGSLTFSQAILY